MNTFEIGQRQIIEDELHAPSRLMRARLLVRHQRAVRIIEPAANFRQIFVGNAQIVPMRQIIEHRGRGGILLAFGQLLDLTDGVAQKLGHGASIMILRENFEPSLPRLLNGDGRVKPGHDGLGPKPLPRLPVLRPWR